MSKIIVFDIDGTVANIEHRRHHVRDGRRNWVGFNRAMVDDTPHEDILWLFKLLFEAGNVMVIASGRGEEDREKTENWLRSHGLYSRKDSIIKREILDQIVAEFGDKPYMVFDDRNQVVDMWRENGIRCLQVAPGNF